jgi:tetratricopeptide (TPR) repeat protein
MIRKIYVLLFIFALQGISPLQCSDSNNSGWYIEKFGHYKQGESKIDHLVERAAAVFERVRKVVDLGILPPPRLFFVADKKKAIALTFPDGGIIISPRTLEICYDGVTVDEGDSRIAFILGHELAHQANQDFGRYNAWQSLKEIGDKKDRQELFQFFETCSNYEKGNELAADRKGALFAAMAGYKISPLLGETNNFLRYWVRKVREDLSYPSVEKRVKSVRIQLQAVKEKVRLFKAGILFLQMGKYTDGAAVFREFSNFYPAREVFNNAGACYLNLALELLFYEFGEEYFRFRLCTAIEYSTAPGDFIFRGEGDYLKDEDIYRNLNKANEYFHLAAKKDPQNRACRYNLSTLLILKREYAAALAQCDEILKKDPYDVKALNNKAIALYCLGKKEKLDSDNTALHFLYKAHLLDNGNFETIYNLAALEEIRGQKEKAKSYQEDYLTLSSTPRDNYYAHIYKKLNKTELLPEQGGGMFPAAPIKIGAKYSFKNFKEYQITSEKSNETDGWIVSLKIGVENKLFVLSIDGYNVIVEQELIRSKETKKLLEQFGPPQKIVHHTQGTFYIYEEKGFSLKEVDGMICSYIWF